MYDSIIGIIIVAGIVVVLFGSKKFPEFMRSIGKATGEFQKGKIEAEKEVNDMRKIIAEPVNEIKNTAAEIKKP